jgi:hypothetical protein
MESLLTRMRVAASVQRNQPYGAGILRSGDSMVAPRSSMTPIRVPLPVAAVTASNVGGFNPLPILETFNNPLVQKALQKPLNALVLNPLDKLWDWLGMGPSDPTWASKAGPSETYRIGGACQKAPVRAGDTGLYVPPYRSATNAALGSGALVGGAFTGPEPLDKSDMKRLRLLNQRLKPLMKNPEAFAAKLRHIYNQGEGYFTKKSYKRSKRYRVKKAKYYAKSPKESGGKYRGSEAFKAHKAKYMVHFSNKKKAM